MSENGEPRAWPTLILRHMPLLDRELHACPRARDPRFGVFFVGISSTGICRRSVRRARRCAEPPVLLERRGGRRAGFVRVCGAGRSSRPASRASTRCRASRSRQRRIAAGALNGRGVDELANDLGVGARQLRRALQQSWASHRSSWRKHRCFSQIFSRHSPADDAGRVREWISEPPSFQRVVSREAPTEPRCHASWRLRIAEPRVRRGRAAHAVVPARSTGPVARLPLRPRAPGVGLVDTLAMRAVASTPSGVTT